MTRGRRLTLALAVLVGAAAAVWLLTAMSTGGGGPLASTLDRAGAAVDALEHRLRESFGGRSRRRALRWLEPYRADVERLRRPDTVLIGAYVGGRPELLDRIAVLEERLETTLPLVHVYTAWGDQPEHQFPVRAVASIGNMGSIPFVTWEPWLSVFDNARHPFLPLRELRDRHGLAAVARGDYDFYIDRWAAEAARYGRPFFLRLGHEMNDPYRYPWGPQHNTKEEFMAAWRHVVDRFRAAGARNAVWVWSPHIAYEYWDLYYPGSEYVDWVATGVLNYGPIAYWSRWWTFDEIFGTKYDRLREFGKPIAVAEFGSLSVGGDRTAWYADALRALPRAYPEVKALLLFHTPSDQTVTYQQVDWTVTGDAALTRTVADGLRALAPQR